MLAVRFLSNLRRPTLLNRAVRSFSSYPEHTVHVMPSLSPTMEAGVICKIYTETGAQRQERYKRYER